MRDSRLRRGFSRLADPKISITSVAAALVGTAVAVRDDAFAPAWLAVLFAALFCMEVAKNAWGAVVDWDSGVDSAVAAADRTPFSGGKRVLVDGLLTRSQTWAFALWFGLVGVGLGAVIVFFREPAALWIGLLGLLLGWSYHGPPLRLAYRGFGELDVVLCYGPLIVVSAHLVQAREFRADALWLSRKCNDRLYDDRGLAAARRALRPGGVFAVWSSGDDPRCERRLRRCGFDARRHRVRARRTKGPWCTIWVAATEDKGRRRQRSSHILDAAVRPVSKPTSWPPEETPLTTPPIGRRSFQTVLPSRGNARLLATKGQASGGCGSEPENHPPLVTYGDLLLRRTKGAASRPAAGKNRPIVRVAAMTRG